MNLKNLITHLRSLEQKATPGLWSGTSNVPFGARLGIPVKQHGERYDYYREEDVGFIAEIRNNLVTLLDALEKAQKETKRLAARLKSKEKELDQFAQLNGELSDKVAEAKEVLEGTAAQIENTHTSSELYGKAIVIRALLEKWNSSETPNSSKGKK